MRPDGRAPVLSDQVGKDSYGNSHARSDCGAGSLGLAGLGFGRVAIVAARKDAGIRVAEILVITEEVVKCANLVMALSRVSVQSSLYERGR